MLSHPVTQRLLKHTLIWVLVLVSVGAFAALGLAATTAGFDMAYRDKIYPGVSIAGVSMGGLPTIQAEQKLQAAIDHALQPGLRFRANGEDVTLPATVVAFEDPDASHEWIRYDVGPAVAAAFAIGRGRTGFQNTLGRLQALLQPTDVRVHPELATDALEQALREKLHDRLTVPKDARLVISDASDGTPALSVEPETVGRVADISHAIKTLQTQAERLQFSPIIIPITNVQPRLTRAELEPLLSDVPAFLAHAPFTVTTENKSLTVTTSTLVGWLTATSTGFRNTSLAIDPDKLSASLAPFVAPYVQEAKDGYLEVKDGRATTFDPPFAGTTLDAPATITAIEDAWAHGSSTALIAFRHVTPTIKGPDAERLGIREIIGVGKSNFSGSPTNRRKNIALGAKKVNGALVGPGEEFSLLQTLRPLDETGGWFPELVIKGNKTVPELGGGLCQIGTTTFRSVLASGLKITQRQNHSYRVRYYEPAGTDATIYDPRPDFRFVNDTPSWILFTTQIKGDDITFTVWGTNDGRVATQTKPKIYNIVPPPPKKEIETLDLPVGKVKCTESAHAGATASFDYNVTYASGSSTKETFTSYYRPWGAVCLVGVEKLSDPAATGVDETGVNNPN